MTWRKCRRCDGIFLQEVDGGEQLVCDDCIEYDGPKPFKPPSDSFDPPTSGWSKNRDKEDNHGAFA